VEPTIVKFTYFSLWTIQITFQSPCGLSLFHNGRRESA